MTKVIRARLRETPEALFKFVDFLDFNADWLQSSQIVQDAKRKLFARLKNEMHEKIAVLSLDDLEFKFLDQ